MKCLEEFNRENDRDLKEPIEIAKADKKVRNSRKNYEECNIWEKRFVDIAELEQKLHHVYDWQEFFPHSLRYKKPFVLNGH